MSFADSMQSMDEMNGDDVRINELTLPLAGKIRAMFTALLTGHSKFRARVNENHIATNPTPQT